MGHIIVPVLLKDDETMDGFVDSSAFDFVLFVLQAMATNDERIISSRAVTGAEKRVFIASEVATSRRMQLRTIQQRIDRRVTTHCPVHQTCAADQPATTESFEYFAMIDAK